ncbi:MAG: amidohydrolase family protein [Sulfolobaceae archaeon]
MKGLIVVPGFIDIHTHGIGGYDFTSWNSEEEFLNNLTKMKEEYLKHGVTTFLPTTVTLPKEVLLEACKAVGEVQDDSRHAFRGTFYKREICRSSRHKVYT